MGRLSKFYEAGARWFFFVLTLAAISGIVIWDIITPPPAGGDPFIYHLSFPASWIKAGRIFYVPLPYGAQAATYYPLNTELFYLWLLLPWGGDFAANLGQVAHWLMCGVSIYAIARHTGIGRPGALIGGMTAMMIPGIVQQVTVARVDVAFSAWMLVSIFFALKWGESRKLSHLILFGAAFGLFCGTKSLAVLYSVIPAMIFLFQISDRGAKALSDIAVAACVAIAAGGFWYVRNWIVTGNPFFPMEFSPGGIHVFPGAYGPEAMRFFHTTDKDEPKMIMLFFMGVWMLIPVMFSTLTTMVLILLRKRSGIGKLFMLAAPWMIWFLFWYVNPHNNLTNGRFVFPAFILFCYSVALTIDEGKEKLTWLWSALLFGGIIGSALIENTDHLFLLWKDIAMAVGGRGNELLGPATLAIRVLLAGAIMFVAFLAVRRKGMRAVVGIGCVVLTVVGMGAAWKYHIEYKYNWYVSFPEGKGWALMEKMTKDAPVNIASVGSERIYGLFGTEMKNNVFSVSVTENPSLDFHEYWKDAVGNGRTAAKGERPQWHREGGSPDAWIKNLRAAGANFVFATKLEPLAMSAMEHDKDGFPVEVSWAKERPETFRLKFQNDSVRIYVIAPEQAPEISK